VLNTIEATMRTEGSAQAVAGARRRAAGPADRAAADQRGAGAEGAAAGRAERARWSARTRRSSRRGGGRGEGRRARADLEVQVGVPREHVARAADAAQQHPDPRPAARENVDGNLTPQAGGVRANVHGAGTDLLNLINDILDLSKIESGTVTVEAEETLLGGEIRLASTLGEGSTFTLYLPHSYLGPVAGRFTPIPTFPSPSPSSSGVPVLPKMRDEDIPDDRNSLQPGDSSILIVEDDPHYARVLLGLARDCGFKAVVAQRGALALSLARDLRPTAISLDVFLPDMLGWTVLNNLKLDPSTRHIPVQIITCEEERQHGLSHGAFAYLVKPTTTASIESSLLRLREFAEPHTKRLLVIEDDALERQCIVELLSHGDIEITAVASGSQAMEALFDRPFDCAVVDLRLPDMTGFELLDKIQEEPSLRALPIIIFTGKDLTATEESQLRQMAKTVVLKDVHSLERLLDETSLFLHRVITDLPEDKQQMLARLHDSNEALRHRKVMIVDDDARNIYALATVLEGAEMQVLSATNGRQAIETIQQTPDIAVVLMDIMMPEMDGFQTMREIRKEARFRSLPILALTAKAMKGDRERCLEAGASDYIAKPVNTDQLLSLLRVWLFR
jgi:CheY-like chemotaxis protein